jgi:hypothetical protein
MNPEYNFILVIVTYNLLFPFEEPQRVISFEEPPPIKKNHSKEILFGLAALGQTLLGRR